MDSTKETIDSATFERMRRAQEHFHPEAMRLPGVHGTSIGVKRVAGQLTETIAICVHLNKKRALADVPIGERIPERIEGFPTDVVEHEAPAPCLGAVPTMEGGRQLRVNDHFGTLGCIVRDKQPNGSTCLLSNDHVLVKAGTTVYFQKDDVCHEIGTTTRTLLSDTIDAGIAKLDVTSEPRILAIGAVKGARSLTESDFHAEVKTFGAGTGSLRYGTIEYLSYMGLSLDGVEFSNQIVVRPRDTANTPFVQPGDSGSVLVDSKDKVVGLISKMIGATGWAGAARIELVESALQIEVLTAQTAAAPLPYPETLLGKLETLLAQSSRGRGYFQTFLQHGERVQHLFHETPRLYAVWRKIPQRAFMAALRAGIREPDSTIPERIDSEDVRSVLEQLRGALAKYDDTAELMQQVDSLAADIVSHIGRTWREALADRAPAVASQIAEPHEA